MLRAVLLALSVALAGCMARIPLPAPVAEQPAPDRPILWVLGLGLYDESWSEGDVAAAATRLAERAPGFQVMPIVLSNGSQHKFAPPDRAAVDAATAEIARRAGPRDIVLVYVSTHGAPGLLAREADRQEQEPAGVAEVAEWLAPLGRRPTVLVLSACFSGSFIPALRAENRIIFAAARADRTSFGCQAGAEHTVFGQAVLDAFARPGRSLREIVGQVRGEVAAAERQLRVSQPSEPQLSVGAGMRTLYDAPLF